MVYAISLPAASGANFAAQILRQTSLRRGIKPDFADKKESIEAGQPTYDHTIVFFRS
jgi:hypothetical protein